MFFIAGVVCVDVLWFHHLCFVRIYFAGESCTNLWPLSFPEVLRRRMQLGLKRAAVDGEDCPDGQKPAPVRRGRPPSTKSKAKAKAKSKEAPKKPQRKSEPKTKTKGKGKAAPVPEEPHMPEEPDMPSEPVVPAEPVPEEPDMPSARKNTSKRKSKQIAADGSAESSKKVTKAKKSTAGAGKKPPAGPGGPGGDDSADGNGGKIPKCFARRRRPASGFSANRWDAIRHAFQHTVMPLLQFFSAHEATDALTFFALFSHSMFHTSGFGADCFPQP